jgi:hypothetical protein
MDAQVVLARLAIAVPIEARHRIATANLKRRSENIQRPDMMAIAVPIPTGQRYSPYFTEQP